MLLGLVESAKQYQDAGQVVEQRAGQGPDVRLLVDGYRLLHVIESKQQIARVLGQEPQVDIRDGLIVRVPDLRADSRNGLQGLQCLVVTPAPHVHDAQRIMHCRRLLQLTVTLRFVA